MWLLIGDLHLTDHARDQYRFGIFNWIRQQQVKTPVAATFLMGDITNEKDKHSATLVNKIVAGLVSLQPPVYIIRGNHDYKADQTNPFFDFLNHIEGLTFATNPTVITAARRVALIPHYRTQDEFDDAIKAASRQDTACYFVHQTFDGAIAESGVRLMGLSASPIESLKPPLGVYAGDVHKPQAQGIVTYIGCPYQVRFGDNFEPRCIYVRKDGVESYPWYEAPRKWSLTVRGPENLLNNQNLVPGDQVKLTLELAREEAVEWKRIKQEVLAACDKLDLEVYGVTLDIKTVSTKRIFKPKNTDYISTLEEFCKTENISSAIQRKGKELIHGNKDNL
jgi:predicted phosphodiesterase